jgi:hypothetical protein
MVFNMQAPSIRQGGNEPTRDGEVNLYSSPEAAEQNWFSHSRRVIFVNGMGNTPRDHAGSAIALSMLQGCPVIGIYNRTNGVWADLGQCIADKLRGTGIVDSTKTGLASWVIIVGTAYNKAKQANPSLQKIDFVGGLVRSNPATYALYSLLVGAGGAAARKMPIIAHSQGNLIVSNALTAVAVALGTDAIAGIEVHSYGSPCRYWPPGLKVRDNNVFTFDPVGFLDLRMDISSSKVGSVVGHSFKLYMQHDAAFVINRYRFGGWGMTLNMDEAGLARALIRMGANAPRVKRILQRLRDVHWSDSDDVAVHYVEKSSVAQLQAMKQADPSVIALLIALMEAWKTWPDEDRAIAKLKAL